MEQQLLHDALTTLGITPNGIKLYLASYASGRMGIGQLASVAGMDRSSAYIACRQLQQAGLLEETDTGKKLVWTKPPKAVMTRLQAQVRRLHNQYDAVEQALPELEAGYLEADHRPILQSFSGHSGLVQITTDILEHADGEILLLTNQAEEGKVFTRRDHKHFIQQRLERAIRIRVLAVDTPEAHQLAATDGQYLRETRIIAQSQTVPFLGETYIYANSVAMLSFATEAVGFIVHSPVFSQGQRWMFEQLWQARGGNC